MEIRNRITAAGMLLLVLALILLAGCGGSSSSNPPVSNPAPLDAGNVNLIFVVSPDLAYQAPGDINPSTANLTNQGLQRSLQMATFLQQKVLGTKQVTGVSALVPMTHLQTANKYPDMAAFETIQQFALLNQITLSSNLQGWVPVTGNSYPLNVSYAEGAVLPGGVASPLIPCPGCQGLDFNDQGNDNETLLTGIIKANVSGFYVFSAPWETTSSLMANINKLGAYNLPLPASYKSPNYIYAISITPAGSASLVTFNSNLSPASTYPVLLSSALVSTPCTPPTPASIEVTGGKDGAVIPKGINTNETIYMIRHAEAHPQNSYWDDGNYICAGQWRALDLPNALRGKISPQQVWSIDPAQIIPGTENISGDSLWSYVRPSLTVEPYAIANNLPYYLAASFDMIAQNPPQLATQASDFFFNGGNFSNQTALVAWEHEHIPITVNALISSYFPNGVAPQLAPDWASEDYDTMWTVTLDAQGNLTADFTKCEGIKSASLPVTCPQF